MKILIKDRKASLRNLFQSARRGKLICWQAFDSTLQKAVWMEPHMLGMHSPYIGKQVSSALLASVWKRNKMPNIKENYLLNEEYMKSVLTEDNFTALMRSRHVRRKRLFYSMVRIYMAACRRRAVLWFSLYDEYHKLTTGMISSVSKLTVVT